MDWYAVIVVPPKEVCGFVDKYRKKYARYTDHVIPPHITIYPPFLITNSDEGGVINSLKKSFSRISPIKIRCDSVNYFEGSKNNVAYFELNKDSAVWMEKFLIKAARALEGKIKDVLKAISIRPQNMCLI